MKSLWDTLRKNKNNGFIGHFLINTVWQETSRRVCHISQVFLKGNSANVTCQHNFISYGEFSVALEEIGQVSENNPDDVISLSQLGLGVYTFTTKSLCY